MISINLETEKLLLRVVIASFSFMRYRIMMNCQSPTKNPDDHPEEDLKTGIISRHILCLFSLHQMSTSLQQFGVSKLSP